MGQASNSKLFFLCLSQRFLNILWDVLDYVCVVEMCRGEEWSFSTGHSSVLMKAILELNTLRARLLTSMCSTNNHSGARWHAAKHSGTTPITVFNSLSLSLWLFAQHCLLHAKTKEPHRQCRQFFGH